MAINRREFLSAVPAGFVALNSLKNAPKNPDVTVYDEAGALVNDPNFVPAILSSVNGHAATPENKDVNISDDVELRAAIRVIDDGHAIYFSDRDDVGVRKWDNKQGPLEIYWHEVKAERSSYDYTRPGRGNIRYVEEPVGSGWLFRPEKELGTKRYKISVKYGGKKFSSSRGEVPRSNGIIKNVHRVSMREADDLPGWMTAWFNLPYVYGSLPEQVENYVGADCADLIVGALHRTGRRNIPYTWSQGFNQYGKTIFRGYMTFGGGFVDLEKRPAHVDVKRGDLLVFKTPSPHVGVFYNDASLGQDYAKIVHTYATGGGIANLFSHSFILELSEAFHNIKRGSFSGIFDKEVARVEVIKLK
ncbi:MAG: hypothetical protein HY515_01890 [Candidatus Aenigmarchaeota archaeon]|nr:hypothetical protein [Candidatus Aenigmarchaeota archaeon]